MALSDNESFPLLWHQGNYSCRFFGGPSKYHPEKLLALKARPLDVKARLSCLWNLESNAASNPSNFW